jgi:hypothetical protein
MVANFSPELEGTNSLLMKRPMGWEYLRPLGAVNWTATSDMMDEDPSDWWKNRVETKVKAGEKEGRERAERGAPRRQKRREGESRGGMGFGRRIGWRIIYVQSAEARSGSDLMDSPPAISVA